MKAKSYTNDFNCKLSTYLVVAKLVFVVLLWRRAAKRGMWAHGTQLETPAQYKKRHGAASIDGKAPLKPPSLLTRKETPSWWRRIFTG